jgi:hypothetical protein
MRSDGFSNRQYLPARRLITPPLMGGAARRLLSHLVVLLSASVTPALAQVPVGLSLSATYARAYGAGGVGPDMGVIIALPGRLLSAHPSVGVTVTAAQIALVGPRDPFLDGDERQLVIIGGRACLEWSLTPRLRLHAAAVLGAVESKVRSGSVLPADRIRPANRVGRSRGLAIGVESGVGVVAFPGALLQVAVAGLQQRAYAEDPVFMPLLRLGVRVLPSS